MTHQQLATAAAAARAHLAAPSKHHSRREDPAGDLASPLFGDGEASFEWPWLTRMAEKANLYSSEAYFREGLAVAMEVLGAETRNMLHRAALLMVKPEGLASGQTRSIVKFLRAHHFNIAAAAEVSVSRLQWRELWRYQLSAATLDRLAINDLIFRAPALMLLVRCDQALGVPATVRLSELKGPSDPSLQPEGCLRRLLRQATRMFSLFHVSDEPADLLRELAILLAPSHLKPFFAQLGNQELSSAEGHLIEKWIGVSDTRTFEVETSIRRLQEALSKADSSAKGAQQAFHDLRKGTAGAWRRFVDELAAADIEIDVWDLTLAGAALTLHDAPGRSKIIDSVDIRAWRESPGLDEGFTFVSTQS